MVQSFAPLPGITLVVDHPVTYMPQAAIVPYGIDRDLAALYISVWSPTTPIPSTVPTPLPKPRPGSGWVGAQGLAEGA